MDASRANYLNALSARKRDQFKNNPKTPLLSLVLNNNTISELNRRLAQLHAEQLRNNPIIANLLNTSKTPRKRKNSI